MVDFAILAPVPLEHLESGYEVAQQRGYVSFGSQKWELFRCVDEMRNGEKVPVLIYPSYEDTSVSLTYQIGWVGWYTDCAEDTDEKRQDELKGHRPPTTAQYAEDNAYFWAVFWRVEDLHPLAPAARVPLGKLASYKTGHWRKNSPPRGPEIVAWPDWFDAVVDS